MVLHVACVIPSQTPHRPTSARPAQCPSPPPGETLRVRSVPSALDYAELVRELKIRYKISIRQWRDHMAGQAYELTYHDGTIKRLIAAPRPRSPVSAAIFLHEVGHHAIGFRRYASRCLEEHYVWQWTFREMKRAGFPSRIR